MNKKKLWIIPIVLFLVISVTMVFTLKSNNHKENTLSHKQEDIYEPKEEENKDQTNNEITEQLEKEEQQEEIKEEQNNNETIKNSEQKVNTEKETSKESSNKQSSFTPKKQESQTPKEEKQQTPKVEEQPKSCIPKKFDMSFVRADFSSFSECTAMGDKYKANGYGYYCDSYQDDCFDTYYMLTLYEPNTGKLFDYHDVEIPN